jgi:5,5'-dehydrodivanillate O-demethylase oxygenase subunit
VLSAKRNQLLTRVGPGTPLGTLLRRYWFPVAFTSDLEAFPTRSVRLLGEDLVVFRDGRGRLGLLEEQCPHRRASLAYGVCEMDGLRCGYHGWLWDRDGRCLEQPGEPADSTFKHRVRATAYRAEEMGGLIWGYLGPEPAPLLPRYDVFVWNNVLRDAGHCLLPVNFMQIMENAVDPHHVEWLHGRFFSFVQELQGKGAARTFGRRHLKIGFDVFEHGIIKRRLLEGETEEDDDWKVGHPLVFPAMMRVGGGGHDQMQIRVPIDDTHTWFILYSCHHPGSLETPGAGQPVAYEIPWRDEQGRHIVDYIEGQDIMAWVTQGPIAQRHREHLGQSDLGVILVRNLFLEQIARVEQGLDPLAVIREPRQNELIDLPCEKNKFGAGREFATEFLEMGSSRYSPQKEVIRELYERANTPAEQEKVGILA